IAERFDFTTTPRQQGIVSWVASIFLVGIISITFACLAQFFIGHDMAHRYSRLFRQEVKKAR
ncbi:hypothetical protein N4Q66_26465, partial [Leclercia adecarboxylata]|uniref:hypothetical protein n=1 Tax=Leclercia adecarboxylata TaxID=83655 RepID=UPI00234E1F12